jgi:bifunctional non-homologous end joining protein LigD
VETTEGSSPLPDYIDPMLATLGSLAQLGPQEQWGYEMKWDGVRAMVRVDAGHVSLTSRNRIDMTVGYPEIAGLGKQLSGRQAMLDGEIVTFDKKRWAWPDRGGRRRQPSTARAPRR